MNANIRFSKLNKDMNPFGCLIHMMPSMDICISSVIMHEENQNSPEKVQTFISKVFCSVITARKRSFGQGNNFTPVCHSVHRLGIPACLAGHMTRQQYISRCTVDVSQLVWRQHTGNIKCMMG